MKYRREDFIEKLIAHEGLVLNVYKDTLGIDTIGIGRNLEDRGISQQDCKPLNVESYRKIQRQVHMQIHMQTTSEGAWWQRVLTSQPHLHVKCNGVTIVVHHIIISLRGYHTQRMRLPVKQV